MDLLLEAYTPVADLTVGSMKIRLKSGEEVSICWNESHVQRNDRGFTARYNHLFIDETDKEPALDMLSDMVVLDAELKTQTGMFPGFEIQSMWFMDGRSGLKFNPPVVEDDIRWLSLLKAKARKPKPRGRRAF